MIMIISMLYIYAMLIALVISDSFWNNLPTLITAVIAGLVSLFGAVKAYQANKIGKENKVGILKVSDNIDGKMTQLLAAKDEVLKAATEAKLLEEAKNAARNEGELKAIKDQELKNMIPPAK